MSSLIKGAATFVINTITVLAAMSVLSLLVDILMHGFTLSLESFGSILWKFGLVAIFIGVSTMNGIYGTRRFYDVGNETESFGERDARAGVYVYGVLAGIIALVCGAALSS